MAVITKIIGQETENDEYTGAVRLKNIIDNTVTDKAFGIIYIVPSVTFYGQNTKDVDILLIGEIKNCLVSASFEHDNKYSKEQVQIDNFCTTVEIKSHSISGVRREGTDWLVQYGTNWHNVTNQSNSQKYAAKNFFENNLGYSPYITNLIWFTGITKDELESISRNNGKVMQSNSLPSSFTFEQMAQLLIWQRTPNFFNGFYHFNCSFGGKDPEAFVKSTMAFFNAKKCMGELTRRKIELITQTEIGGSLSDINPESFNIFRGRAGTGKTIALMRTGVNIVEDLQKRALILTYNRALVSDIRRLLALSELPDMFEEKCLGISTMHAFFFGLINTSLYNGNMSGEEFLNNYEKKIKEMIDFLKSDVDSRNLVSELCKDDSRLYWDYILVDEAQDWTDDERDLLFLLFDKKNILVADGGNQFVRRIEPCDWTVVHDRHNIKLKYCLRQKDNLINFINAYSKSFNVSGSRITSPGNMPGGNIILVRDNNKIIDVIRKCYSSLKHGDNAPYDMLLLAPSTIVTKDEDGNKCFALKNEFEKHGVLLWDGTNDNNRIDYATNPLESRVVQYESARGLEGWIVVCLDFDAFLSEKEKQFDPEIGRDSLMLESDYNRKSNYMLNWAMIPMTRPIDTLVISFSDINSRCASELFGLADVYKDFVEII